MSNKITINTNMCEIHPGASSKGNQSKWLVENKWYKADHMGYEALSEVLISELLSKTNIRNYVAYMPTFIEYNDKLLTGCYSENFKKDNETIYTLEKLFRAYTGRSLAKELTAYTETKDKIYHTVDFLEKHTQLKGVGEYLTAMLELDAFFLNEDRHTNNIAFIRNDDTKEFRVCPYFDFGLSLLSDINDYPLDTEIHKNITKIKAKPFDIDFDAQTDAAEELYGVQIQMRFTEKDVLNAVTKCEDYYASPVLKRVAEIVFARKSKYQYFFSKRIV